jgi:hypothetical protein
VRSDLCSIPDATALKDAGFRLIVWQDLGTNEAQLGVDRFGAQGYIAQSETLAEQGAASLVPVLSVPRALVGSYWLPGWECLLETYMVDVPSSINGFPVLRVWHGFPLEKYPASLAGRKDFSVYLAERKTEAHIEVFRNL